jgi:hypothetical protein
MAERIIDGTQFNTDQIIFCAPKATAQGSKSINLISKTTKTSLTLSTPLMLTWGASDYKAEGEEKGNGRFEMSLQFPSDEYKTEDTDAFFRNIQSLENKIKENALLYSKEWFGKVHKSSEVVDALWTPMLKYVKDKATGDYDYTKKPTLRLKLPQWEGVWKSEIYDEEGNKLFPSTENSFTPVDYLKKGTNVMCLIQFGGIWFVNGKFSANWKLIQAVVQKPRAVLQGQCFIKMKSQDKDKLKSQVVLEEDVEGEIQGTIVDDSDAEDGEDGDGNEEEVVIPKAVVEDKPVAAQVVEVAATPIKKKVVKKKD